jgi:pilus assembly protein FimV
MLGRTSSLIVCAALFPIGAAAMSLGRTTAVASLGQALQFRVPITLESGETILPECIAVQVTHGESRLDPQVVRYTLEPQRTPGVQMLAVRTLVPIEELVLQVTVGIGCPPRYTRSYTLFPDPPTVTLAAVPAEPVESAADAGAAASRSDAAASGSVAAAADAAVAPPPPAPPRPKVRPPPRSSAKSAKSAKSATPAARPALTAAATAATASPRPPAGARASEPSASRGVAAGGARLLLDPTAPRLKLDLDEPVFMGPSASSVATASADDALELQRLKALESTLAQLQQEGQRQRTNNTQLQKQLQAAQADQRWIPWLIGLLALSLAAAAWLAWRLRRRRQTNDWWGASAGESSLAPLAPPVPPQEDDDEADLPAASRVQATRPPDDDDDWRSRRGAAFATAAAYGEAPQTLPLGLTANDLAASPSPAPAVAAAPAAKSPGRDVDAAFDWKTSTAVRLGGVELPREMAVEELLDLEQQADFFIALGQEDAAIELLMVHLRSTRGMSPLPYTQLLELYRKLGDKDAYEKIRSRFNRQFNAHVPDWDAGPSQGRTLEEYPAIVEQLQALWATPPEAMKTLEAMLIRRDDQSELFDLPAYRDVLMLYALARDLAQQRDDVPRDVDVMLPLSPDTEFGRYLDSESLDFDLTRPIDAPAPASTQSAAFRSTDLDPNFDIKLK